MNETKLKIICYKDNRQLYTEYYENDIEAKKEFKKQLDILKFYNIIPIEKKDNYFKYIGNDNSLYTYKLVNN